MFLDEIGKTLHRARTWVFAVGLAGLGVLPVVILLASPHDTSGGPPFFEFIERNGLFAALTSVALMQPFFLPLGVALLSGEAVAGEASAGTLRYLTVRPVGRIRLILAKYGAVMAEVTAGVAWVMVVALVAGGIAFGFGPLPTLSGVTVGTTQATLRIAAAAGYVLIGMAGLAGIGLFLSTLTTSGPGATVATMAVAIASQILDNLRALRPIHPYLISHRWLAFVDLFRSPIEWQALIQGVVLAGAYTAVFLGAAVLLFRRKDVVT